MPFKTNEIQLARPTPLNGTSTSAPTAKRPRVAPPVAEQGRKGKENAPSQRPVATEKQKPVGKPIMISGGVAEEMEKRLKEKLEWSERQKKREEEVKRRREEARMSEAVRPSFLPVFVFSALTRCSSFGLYRVEKGRNYKRSEVPFQPIVALPLLLKL